MDMAAMILTRIQRWEEMSTRRERRIRTLSK
jgi:hypothetical protein